MEYKPENLICQNCKNDFTIEPEDFSFYEKIKVPPPTFCPECRAIRRLTFRNMRSLYKRECSLCGAKGLVSVYPDDGCPVYCLGCFNGDNWDQYINAKDIDFSRDFFSQVYELFKIQPRVYQFRIGNVINSDYGNAIANSKNSYLCFSSLDNEDVMYSENIDKSKKTVDSYAVYLLDNCYWNSFSHRNYNSHFILSSNTCIDSYFLYDCANCQNCCLSSNLRNQQYVFRNQKLSKEDYEQEIQKLKLKTYSGVQKAQKEFEVLYKNAVHKYAQIISSPNSTGDLISNSKNIHKSVDIVDSCEDVKYGIRMISCKNIMDLAYSFSGELLYECMAASDNAFNQVFSFFCNGSKNMQYSMFCKNSTDCFGSVGLKNAKYCILNKQYSKEEYQKMVPQIIDLMNTVPYIDKKNNVYKYGEFFPSDFSPFVYNETVALDIFPMSREKIIETGYEWREREKRIYNNLLQPVDLPDDISDVEDLILEKAIFCPNDSKAEFQCTGAFKIVPDELAFYRAKNLPIPRYCPNCRHYQRLAYRNPAHLWHRKCMKEGCENIFQTPYAPERPEIVYCERCYQQEVY